MKRSDAVKSLAKMIITINNAVDEETGEPDPLDELQKATVYIAYMEELGMMPPGYHKKLPCNYGRLITINCDTGIETVSPIYDET